MVISYTCLQTSHCFKGFPDWCPRPESIKHFFAFRLEYEAEKEAVLDRVVALMCGRPYMSFVTNLLQGMDEALFKVKFGR